MKIYVYRQALGAYVQYSSTAPGSSVQNWCGYESYLEPYDFE